MHPQKCCHHKSPPDIYMRNTFFLYYQGKRDQQKGEDYFFINILEYWLGIISSVNVKKHLRILILYKTPFQKKRNRILFHL
jgi:hypothetical protein